jgi:hypothetical protein
MKDHAKASHSIKNEFLMGQYVVLVTDFVWCYITRQQEEEE